MESHRPSVRRKSSNLLGALNRHSTGSTVGSNSLNTPDEDVPPLPAPGVDGLRATIQKRLTTWSYLRRVHESRAHWMNTYLFGRDELDRALAKGQLGGVPLRTQRLAVLGMSLSSLLDISNSSDFLKGLLSLMSEWEGSDGEVRPKTGKSRIRTLRSRKSGTFDLEESFLFLPNIPFELDYFEVLLSLCDILGELYTKILLLLGGQPNTPLPNGQNAFVGGSAGSINTLHSDSRTGLNATMIEQVQKIDHRFKKMLAPITKELEVLAREAIRSELAQLGSGGSAWELED